MTYRQNNVPLPISYCLNGTHKRFLHEKWPEMWGLSVGENIVENLQFRGRGGGGYCNDVESIVYQVPSVYIQPIQAIKHAN